MLDPAPTQTPKTEPLSFKEKLGFGLGDFGNNLFWQFFMYYVLYFYTDIFRIAPGAQAAIVAGKMFVVVRAADALFDVLVGVLADRTHTRWGKYRPYLLYGAIPFGISGILAFTTPDLETGTKIVYAYITYSLMMLVYSLVSIPQNALLGVLTPDSQQRTILAKYKFAFAFAAGLVVQFFTPILVRVFGTGQANSATGYQGAVFCYAVLATVLLLVAFATTKERVSVPHTQRSSLKADFSDLLGNGPWLMLCVITLISIIAIAIRCGTIIYWFKYYVGEQAVNLLWLGTRRFSSEELLSAYLVLGTVVSIVGTLCVPYFTKRLGKRTLYALLMSGAGSLMIAYYFVRPEQITLIFLLQIPASLLLGPSSSLLWAMYADCADYSEWKNGRRATGLVFSAAIMAQKFGWTFGAALPLWMLATFGYASDAPLTAQALFGIKLVCTIIPGAFGLCASALTLGYSLSEKRLESIECELSKRREQAIAGT